MKLKDVANLSFDSNGVPNITDSPVLSQVQGTILDADLVNALIQEIYNVILGFDLKPSSDNTQLYQVIKSLKDEADSGHQSVISDMTDQMTNLTSQINSAAQKAEQDLSSQENDVRSQMQKVYAGLVSRAQNSASMLQSFMKELVGKPFPCSSDTVPSGCLPCDGASFSTSMFPMLAEIYPSGVLPDLRGKFIRGTNTSTSQINPDGTSVLGEQEDAVYAGVDFANSPLGFLTTSHARAQWTKHGSLAPGQTPAPTPAFEAMSTGTGAKFADLGAWNSWGNQTRQSIWVALNFLNNVDFRYATETRPASTTMQWVVYTGIPFELSVPDLS